MPLWAFISPPLLDTHSPPKQAYYTEMTFLVAQMVKSSPAMWETWAQSLGWEDPLEEEMATHSSILANRIPWIEEPGGLQSTGCKSWIRLSDKTTTTTTPTANLSWMVFHALSQPPSRRAEQG